MYTVDTQSNLRPIPIPTTMPTTFTQGQARSKIQLFFVSHIAIHSFNVLLEYHNAPWYILFYYHVPYFSKKSIFTFVITRAKLEFLVSENTNLLPGQYECKS